MDCNSKYTTASYLHFDSYLDRAAQDVTLNFLDSPKDCSHIIINIPKEPETLKVINNSGEKLTLYDRNKDKYGGKWFGEFLTIISIYNNDLPKGFSFNNLETIKVESEHTINDFFYNQTKGKRYGWFSIETDWNDRKSKGGMITENPVKHKVSVYPDFQISNIQPSNIPIRQNGSNGSIIETYESNLYLEFLIPEYEDKKDFFILIYGIILGACFSIWLEVFISLPKLIKETNFKIS